MSPWAANVPLGTPWIFSPVDISSIPAPKKTCKCKSKNTSTSTESAESKVPDTPPSPPPPFYGDRVLSDLSGFMRDAMLSREVAAAVAEGAVGRVWEGLKVMP